ncbi:MAG: anthranilate phosphoribosyltransferase [Armatimonadetes bacterium]|nr:anthranilate phosphoribosyltransferase [Armatimonadota bacterium]
MIRDAIQRLIDGADLTREDASRAMGEIMDGEATPAQIGAFVTALRMKGETIEEITGFATAMRARVARIEPKVPRLVDTCGTGGDRSGTFNISTTAAFVVAGAGAHVAKHGNRAVSSKSGSADVLLALGVPIDTDPRRVAEAIEFIGIGFLFAPRFHPAMQHAIGPRQEIGIRTVFNILGPLTNPAGASRQVLGVYDAALVDIMARVLGELGTEHAFVVHSDGLDEVSLSGETHVAEVRDGHVRTFIVTPEDGGVTRRGIEEIRGGDADYNARVARDVFDGRPGAHRDVVVLNAALALVAAGLASTFEEGAERAAASIDSGAAAAKLEALRRYLSS